jgi:hypothetical protein
MAGVVTATYSIDYKLAGVWTAIADGAVIAASGGASSGLSDNGAGFGDEAITDCTLQILLSEVDTLTFARLPVRATFAIDAASSVAFVGEVAEASGDLETVTWRCESMLAALPGRTRDYYSALRYRRPPATKTTASSIENPASGSYAGGLVNELLWHAGGRPYEQAGSYPTADFYYSCEQAIRAPDWSWLAGENGYEEAKRLIRSVGGQIYQGMDGVIRYRQPLTMVGTASVTYTLPDFHDLSWSMVARDQYAAAYTVAYTPRHIQPTQKVIEDTTIREIAAGEAITIDLEPQWPLYSVELDGGTLKEHHLSIAFYDGRRAAYHASLGYTVVTTVTAMRITAVITNNAARAMQLTKITILGRPITAGETGTMTAGSGTPVRVLEDNIFVQTRRHAQALATMQLSFAGTVRRLLSLKECVYDVARVVGETVNVTIAALGLSAAPHVILAKHYDKGEVMDLDLLDADGLPALADYWLCSTAAQTGSKKVAW